MNLSQVTSTHLGAREDVSKAISLAVPLGGIIASVLIAVLIIWPKINEIFELKRSNEQLVMRAQKLEDKAALLASLDKNKLEEQLAAAEQVLPSEKKVFTVLKQVEDAAATSGILLNKIDVVVGTLGDSNSSVAVPVTGETGNNLQSVAPVVQVKLSTTSDYSSLIRFLSTAYSFSRVISIDLISLNAGIGESVQIRTSLSLDAYWKSLPTTLGSIENSIQKLTPSEEELLAKVLTPEIIEAPVVPQVSTGRSDLFTPF